jgi:hypothetical protein
METRKNLCESLGTTYAFKCNSDAAAEKERGVF